MRKFYPWLLLLALPIYFIFQANNSGSPGGRTGSIGDGGQTCTGCHSGTAQLVTGWITTNIPTTGYTPGQTYTITVTGTHTGVVKFGFELTAENATGTKVGTFVITNSTQTKLVNQNKAVTHTAAGTTPSGNTKSWSVNWTAPNPGVGPVTFYAALNAANGNGTTSGDVIYRTLTTVNQAQAGVDITFRVDMSLVNVSPLGVHIAGNFQGWNPGSSPMVHVGNSIYEATFNLTPGFTAEYKFINGNAWGMEENVVGPCTTGPYNNRFLVVPPTSTVLPAVCFGSCNICNPPQVSITFQVDMSQQNISPQGVFIAGTFNGWNTTANPMNHIGNNIYALTLSLGSGDYHQYKFLNGPIWETVPTACAQNQNRFILVPSVSTTLDAVCFGSCNPCGPPPVPVQVTFQVDMSLQTVSPEGVHIAGGFQGWNPGSTLMTHVGNNIYSYTTTLPSGTYQEFKYINGTTWAQAENVPPPCGVNNNRWLIVPNQNTTLPVVCFGECGPCGPPPVPVLVTFSVDLANETVSPQGVHLAGSFQGWNPSSTPMTNLYDKVYQATVTILSGTYIEYKFINGNTFDGKESVPPDCGVPDGFGGYNRYFTVPDINIALPTVCFSSCNPCEPPLPDVEVTFRVDMSYQIVSPQGVHLAGTFQGWNPAATPMQHAGNNIYQVTLLLPQGSTHEYKFINGNTFAGAELVPPECSQNGNRYLTVPNQNLILPAVCFGSCEPCGPPPVNVQVTFRVDMSLEQVSPLGIHIAGSFQGWNPGSTNMTHTGNSIYSYTATLLSGSYVEYKFINGNAWGMDENVPAACANNNNRYLTVPSSDTVLMAVCFGQCVPCNQLGIPDPYNLEEMTFYPNPVHRTLHLIYPGEWVKLTIWSSDGREIFFTRTTRKYVDLALPAGKLYFVSMESSTGLKKIKKLLTE